MIPTVTVRVRLTMLYTVLFVACGAIVVAITYGLVASSLRSPSGVEKISVPANFLQTCKKALSEFPVDPNLKAKCQAAFAAGVDAGAKTQRDAVLADLLGYSLTTLAAVTLLAALAGWFVAGRVLRPVGRITAAARAASEHNLSARVAMSGPRDELRELADTLDAMLGRLEAAFEGQRRFIANASHELRTPLAVMRATVDVVLAKPAPTVDELIGMGIDVRGAVERAEALVEALLTLARSERGLANIERTDLATVVEDVLDTAGPGDSRVHLNLLPAPIHGDLILLERLAGNLVDNALRHNVPDGEVWIGTSTVDGRAALTVTNTGPVVPAAAVDGLFTPFRRLHERTGADGVGLGLAIVASITALHGGKVSARPHEPGGLEVTVTLPEAETPEARRSGSTRTGGNAPGATGGPR